jgi:hypothetical protein
VHHTCPMKSFLITCLILLSSFAWAADTKTFSNLDDRMDLDNGTKGWGWCSDCAGGENTTEPLAPYFQQYRPSLDGSSLEFLASATLPFSNVLWYYKLGPHDNYDSFQFNFGYTVDEAASTVAQALEFDTFQFVKGLNYTFGTQCDFGTGYWNIFNDATQSWVSLDIGCIPVARDWYRITWNLHRSANQTLTYDSFMVQHYNSTGRHLLDQNFYTVGMTVGSTPVPTGYTDNLGVQFQIDLGPYGGTMPMWVDRVSLTASAWRWSGDEYDKRGSVPKQDADSVRDGIPRAPLP